MKRNPGEMTWIIRQGFIKTSYIPDRPLGFHGHFSAETRLKVHPSRDVTRRYQPPRARPVSKKGARGTQRRWDDTRVTHRFERVA